MSGASPHALTGGLTQLGYRGFYHGASARPALELGYRLRPARADGTRPLSLGGGLRLALPREDDAGPPGELYAQGAAQGELGRWQPLVGVELGLSGLHRLRTRERGALPPGVHALEQERASALYLGFNVAPLRLGLGRWTLSVLEVQLGVTLLPPGAIRRTQLAFARVGYSL